ncbi:hypothetical protein Nepgr_029373 [Nepenthes gracilis]|uniref:Uncharacterized protein n=1 Tax=Nepenthes gracilis TaxID=150966 RepID=A0AAD3TCC9_NEPGR|nr:hypothetical protein Nepgr_029373 [Nepenthes gracilis]
MFPSNITCSLQNPFEYSSIDESPNTYFLNFPAQLLGDDELLMGDLLHHQHHHQQHTSGAAASTALPQAPEVGTKNSNRAATAKHHHKDKENAVEEAVIVEEKTPVTGKKKRSTSTRQLGAPRRRTGKKDRHSKINTAQGPRDRRMRLSLQIARKFFDLQDMLGFDKASKTIEWLFTKSKAAIKDLTASLPQKKNTSCRSVSSAASECMGEAMEESEKDLSRRNKSAQQGALHHHLSLARESRDKARARARQRTREKILLKEIEKSKQSFAETNPDNYNNNNLEKLGSSSTTTPETGEESAGCRSQELTSSVEISAAATALAVEVENCSSCNNHQSLDHQKATVAIMERLLGTSRSASIFDYHHHEALPVCNGTRSNDYNFLGLPGNWIAENARNISSGYSAAVMNIISTPLHQDQNPNSNLFMASSPGIYLQPQYPQNQIFNNNYLYANRDRSSL